MHDSRFYTFPQKSDADDKFQAIKKPANLLVYLLPTHRLFVSVITCIVGATTIKVQAMVS